MFVYLIVFYYLVLQLCLHLLCNVYIINFKRPSSAPAWELADSANRNVYICKQSNIRRLTKSCKQILLSFLLSAVHTSAGKQGLLK